ncbi:hypothetical protein QYE76_049979 [Lolium multiflorum]|uniref:Auxin efflux carrier component n=1 Tax=Lolium multiflorum TaxID=4521 RepID=A0AAD8SPY0_LOLMU|nr:hypothetical protein QYE76_049979 [Lolium multiflorum]
MITWHELYMVMSAVVPLYVPMLLAYGSVRWWAVITPEQCGGINRFVAVFAVPLLIFKVISASDLYAMDIRFAAADTLQKLLVLAALAVWCRLAPSSLAGLDCSITLFSFSTLPNTLVVGIPLIAPMYGPHAADLVVQLVVLQCIVWYTMLIFLFEFRAARLLVAGRFPGGVATVCVDPDVVSLDVDGSQADGTVVQEGSTTTVEAKDGGGTTPPFGVRLRLILPMVWRRLIRNPNTYACVLGLTWSLIKFRFHITMPAIVANSISILSDAGLGMAMFSLGLFMAMQPKIIAGSNTVTAATMAVRFLLGPAVMAIASAAVGLRGTLLRIAIVQAAIPLGIVPFVFAKEYNLHAAILCTG